MRFLKYILAFLFLPSVTFAAFTIPLSGTTTTGTILAFPTAVNGILPSVISPFFTATSTSATSTFKGGITQGGAEISTTTTLYFVDSNRSDSYSQNGSTYAPYKTVTGANTRVWPSAAGYTFFLMPGTYVEGAPLTFGTTPLLIQGNESTLVVPNGVTFNGPYDIFDTTISGAIHQAHTSLTSIHQMNNGIVSTGGALFQIDGNATLANMVLANSTLLSNSYGALSNIVGTAILGAINNYGTINLDDDFLQYGTTTSYLLTATTSNWSTTGAFGNVNVLGATVIATSTFGAFNVQNGATSTPNYITAVAFTSAGPTITAGSAATAVCDDEFSNPTGGAVQYPTGTNWISCFDENRVVLNRLGVASTTPGVPLAVTGPGVFTGTVTSPVFFATSTATPSTFQYASSTALSGTYLCLGTDCRTSWPTGGTSAYSFTPTTNLGVLTQATSGILFLQNGLQASSTAFLTNASTSLLTTGTLYGRQYDGTGTLNLNATGDGYYVNLNGSNALTAGSSGGGVNVTGGNGSTTATGGAITFTAGSGSQDVNGTGNGSSVSFYGGAGGLSGNTNGGDIDFAPGLPNANGSNGRILLFANSSASVAAQLDPSQIASTNKVFKFPNWTGELVVSTSTTQVSSVNATSSTATSTFTGQVNIGNGALWTHLTVGTTSPVYSIPTNYIADLGGTMNDYISANVYNNNGGPCATSDWTAGNDKTTALSYFADLGHTSHGFTGSGCVNNPFPGFGADATFLFDPDGPVNIAAASSTNSNAEIRFFTQGYVTPRARITSGGFFGIASSSPGTALGVNGAAVIAGTVTAQNLVATSSIFQTVSGILKGNGISTAVSAAANGTDYTLMTANTCSAGQHISAVTASGGSTCSADTSPWSYPWSNITYGGSLAESTTTIQVLQQVVISTTTIGNANIGTLTASTSPTFQSLTGIMKANGTSPATVAVNGTDFSLITALSCSAGNHLATVAANGTFTCTADSGSGSSSIVDKFSTTTAGTGVFLNSAVYAGFGTTSPGSMLSIHATSTNGTGSPLSLFAVASSSQGTATTTLFSINNIGTHYANLDSSTSTLMNLFSQSFLRVSTSSHNTALGLSALGFATTSDRYLGDEAPMGNVAVGDFSLYNSTTSPGNTAVGFGALQGSGVVNGIWSATGLNTAVGYFSLASSTSGNSNTALGYLSGRKLTTGIGNVFVGSNSGDLGTITGNSNTGVGFSTFHSSTFTGAGGSNTAIGQAVMSNLTTGGSNTGVGASAMNAGTMSGSDNSCLGVNCLRTVTSANNNTTFGFQTGRELTTGSDNIIIGEEQNTGGNNITTGWGNICFGYNPCVATSTATNRWFNLANGFFGLLPATTTATQQTDPTNGAWGFGSSTPWGLLSVHLNSGWKSPNIGQPAFVVGSSTATATTTLFEITNMGHILGTSTTPTLSACGTTPSMQGDDRHGEITTGTTATGCTVTFALPYSQAPVCTVTWQAVLATMSYTISASAITITQTSASNNKIDYICEGLGGSQ